MRNLKTRTILTTLALMAALFFTFGGAASAETLTLPEKLQSIEAEAFMGNTRIDQVIVPEGVISIGERAFSGCTELTEITLPASLTFIAEDAFENCGTFKVNVPENCYAYDQCIQLGLIQPQQRKPESAHPYADEFDHTWIYDAGEGVESVTITFSSDTETEEAFDFIFLYTLDDAQIGKYSGKKLAGQSITIDGAGFKLRLTSDEALDGSNTYYGFRIENIEIKKIIPLGFESITAESNAVTAGEIIRWTVKSTGGKAPIYYDYTILRGEEEMASGTAEADPGVIEYAASRVGEYKISVVVRDSAGKTLPAQMSAAVTAAPTSVYPASPHPYPARWENSWFYAAEENVESLSITFSAETKIESRDRLRVYDQLGRELGVYTGTELSGRTLVIPGSAFSLKLTNNDGYTEYGFDVTNIEKYIPTPLRFISLTADKAKAKVGDMITWTMETEGGHLPVSYQYTITLNGETTYSSAVTRPDKITYIPLEAGDHIVNVVAVDGRGNTLEAKTSQVRIGAYEATPEEAFTYAVINGQEARITGYTGEGTNVIIPSSIAGYRISEIGDSAFRNHATLVSVSLPSTIVKIANYAFANCDSLQAVRMEEGLLTLGSRVFEDCDALRSIAFPDSITTFSDRVLRHCDQLSFVHFPAAWTKSGVETVIDCPRLTRIELPEGLTVVPENAFQNCRHIEEVSLPSTIKSIQKKAFNDCIWLRKVNLPEGLNDIQEHAFRNTALTSIDVPASVTYLSGFYGCRKLTDVHLREGLVEIGISAFDNCSGLVEIEIPEGVEIIGNYAFAICPKLKSIDLPDSVRAIGKECFIACSSLEYFGYPLGLKETYGNNIFKDCPKLTSVTIPEGVTLIPGYLFYGHSFLKEISIPDSVEIIQSSAFEYCTALTKIELPESLKELHFYVFQGCTNLKEVVFNSKLQKMQTACFANCTSLTEINPPDTVEEIGELCFENCTNLESFHYPASWNKVTSRHNNGHIYGGNIFTGCPKLTSITVTEGATIIPHSAFAGMPQLKEIHLPSTLETIESYAFASCAGLTKVILPENLKTLRLHVFNGCTNLKEVDFNEGLRSIQAGCFTNCTSLVYADLPDSVKEIGELCFENCTNLESFHYPMNWEKTTSRHDNGFLYGGDTFLGCVKLTSYTIPEGVKFIPQDAFAGASSLTEIHFPSTLETIGTSAFARCTGLTKVVLPENLKTLRPSVFNGCTNLKDVVFNDGLESVQASCFANCTSLVDADFPDSVKEIGELCFENCISLESFHYPMSWERTTSRHDNGFLYGGDTFLGCVKLTSYTIPEGVKKIPQDAFAGASSLTEIHLPSTLEIIGPSAFSRCTGLTKVVLPANLKTLRLGVFNGCTNLKEVVFNEGLESVQASCFTNCISLVDANLPDSVKELGELCFENCISLKSFHYPRSLNNLTSRHDNGHIYGGGTFINCELLTSISVPEGVQHIPASLFQEANYLQNISLPYSLTSIGSTAFAGAVRLEKVYLSPNVTTIWDNAFNNCPVLTIWTEYGAYGLQYAIQKGIPYYYLTPDGVNIPSGTLYKGDDYAIYGYARSSVNINNLTATIWNSNGSAALQSVNIAPGVTDYSLAGVISSGLDFSSLPVGTYCYTLRASTDVSEELWADTTFRIIPPPLRVSRIGLNIPYGLYGEEDTIPVAGTISANYPMSRIIVGVYDDHDAPTPQVYTGYPNQYSFDLANAGLNIHSLPGGSYVFKVIVTGNGETITAVCSDFTLSSALSIDMSMVDRDDLSAFLADKNNRNPFENVNYYGSLEHSLTNAEKIKYALYTSDQKIRSSMIDAIRYTLGTGAGQRSDYLITLYKEELVSHIKALGHSIGNMGFKEIPYQETIDDILELKKLRWEFIKENLGSKATENEKKYVDNVNKFLEAFNWSVTAAEYTYELAGYIYDAFQSYTEGIQFLDTLAASYLDPADWNYNYQLAVEELKQEFTSNSLRLIHNCSKFVANKAVEWGQDKLIELSVKALAGGEIYIAYKIVSAAWNFVADETGFYDDVAKLDKYRAQVETFNAAYENYKKCFDELQKGNGDEDTLSRLIQSFMLTKSAGIRSMETLKTLPMYERVVSSGELDRLLRKFNRLHCP